MEELKNHQAELENIPILLRGNLAVAGSNISSVESKISESIINFNLRNKANNEKNERALQRQLEIERDANNPKKHFDSGVSLLREGKFLLAISEFNQVIRLAPDIADGYFYRGYTYFRLNIYDKALQDFNYYLEQSITIRDENFYIYRGWCYNYTANYINAIKDFNKVIELKPDLEEGYFGRGYAKSNLKDYIGGNIDYTKAIQINPNNSMCYNNRGWNKFELKDNKSALSDVSKAIELDNENYVAWDSRSEIKFNMKDLLGAISDADQAIILNPNSGNPYLIRGRAKYRLQKQKEACEDWSKAGELGKIEAYDFIKKYCN